MKKIFFSITRFSFLLISINSFANLNPVELKPTHIPGTRAEKPSISKAFFGETEGQKIYQYTLKNSNGMMVKVISYGGAITDIITPDKNKEMGSVVLGFDSLTSYTGRDNSVMGGSVGRVANRIANKKFTLDGNEYNLTSNIHGGLLGFHKRIWNIQEVPGSKEVALKMTYLSKDGEEGFPGNLHMTITYTLTNNNELKINYMGTTDKPTPVNVTNHSYFNLSGGKDDKILNTALIIYADQFLEATAGLIPSGNFLDVKGTPFDFSKPQKIGKRISESDAQLTLGSGYDHTFVLRNQTGKLALAASAYEPLSGRVMEMYTTEPGVIFYTANHLSEKVTGRGGKPFTKNGAFCLETQHYPDSPNQPKFPGIILRPGETYKSQTVYKFSVRH
ncbi:MAG: aldose epimerase family protein [Chitinophagaceae bacterium]